jgi:uncharacterized membrane protein
MADEDVVQETLADAWALYRDDFVLFLIAGLLVVGVSIVTLGLLSGPLVVGFVDVVERRRRGEDAAATDVFDGFGLLAPSLVATVLIVVGTFIGLLLFVVPGLVFAVATTFTFQAIAIDRETATGAIGRSIEIVRDHLALSIVFIVIVIVLNSLGGLVLFGTFLTLPYCLILMTLAYDRLARMA